MNWIDYTWVCIFVGLGIVFVTGLLINFAYADSIHIDDYRPVGKETTIQIDSFGIIHNKYAKIQTNVTISVNNMNYTGETNKYGFIAFPIKLTDNVFDAGSYDMIIQIGENIHKRILHVIESSY